MFDWQSSEILLRDERKKEGKVVHGTCAVTRRETGGCWHEIMGNLRYRLGSTCRNWYGKEMGMKEKLLGGRRTMAGWCKRELQCVCDVRGIEMVIFERMSTEKCGEPGYTQRVCSRGANFVWYCSFLKVVLLLYFSFDLYYRDGHSAWEAHVLLTCYWILWFFCFFL